MCAKRYTNALVLLDRPRTTLPLPFRSPSHHYFPHLDLSFSLSLSLSDSSDFLEPRLFSSPTSLPLTLSNSLHPHLPFSPLPSLTPPLTHSPLTQARTHARTHARTYAHMHVRTHAHTHARTHTHTHVRTHAHTHTHTEAPSGGLPLGTTPLPSTPSSLLPYLSSTPCPALLLILSLHQKTLQEPPLQVQNPRPPHTSDQSLLRHRCQILISFPSAHSSPAPLSLSSSSSNSSSSSYLSIRLSTFR